MGPEALMVMAWADYRADLAEFARWEYSSVEDRRVEAMIRRELEELPVKRSARGRLLRWGRELFRHEEARPTGTLAFRPKAIEIAAELVPRTRDLSGVTLAALPAVRAGTRPEGTALPISAVPAFVRG